MKLNNKRNLKILSIMGLFVLWILLSNLIVGNNINNKINSREIKFSKIIKENAEYQNLKKYLIDLKGSTVPWISRKEIASWSATILYLSVILIVLNKLKLFYDKKLLSIIFLVIFTLLILLFTHQQFGQMVNSLASQRAINKYIYLITMEDSTIVNFDFRIEEKDVIPKSLAAEIECQAKKIRKLPFCQRIFLPTAKIFWKNDIMRTVEIQEGILYNIIFLAFFFLFIIILWPCKVMTKNEKKSNN